MIVMSLYRKGNAQVDSFGEEERGVDGGYQVSFVPSHLDQADNMLGNKTSL